MKKYFWMAALASVAFASCVNEEMTEVNQEQSKRLLSFGAPVMYNQSRIVNGEISGSTYPTEENFVVYGFEHRGQFAGWGVNEEKNASDQRYFPESGEEVQHRPNSSYWDTATNYYLPTEPDHYLSFLACSPVRAKNHGTFTVDSDGLTITDWKMQANSSIQYDLMCSTVTANVAQARVPINFYHTLSSICFSFSKADNGADTPHAIHLTSVKVGGDILNKGTFKQNLPGTSNIQGAPRWKDLSKDGDNEYVLLADTKEVFVEGSATTAFVGGNFLPIPQQVNSDMYVEISYTIQQEEGEVADNKTLKIPFTNFIKTGGSVTEEWLMSNRYTYHIHFGALTKIFFAPTIMQNWIENDNAGVYTIQ